MEIDLIPERTYTARVGHVEIKNLRLVEQWEGMAKLVAPDKSVLIVTSIPRPGEGFFSADFGRVLDEIFGKQGDLARRVYIVKATPGLIDQLAKGTIKKEPAGA